MKLINFSLFKKIGLLCVLLFVLNLILNFETKQEGFYIETTVDTDSTNLALKVQKQKEKSCSNCRESASGEHVNSKCADTCD